MVPPPPGGGDPADEPGATSRQTEELGTSQGAERLIPLRFVNLLASAPPSTCPSQALHDGLLREVSRANHAFRAAGIQFFIRSMECYEAPHFYWPDVQGAPNVSWATAYAELGGPGKALPSMPSDAWLSGAAKHPRLWLGATATQYGRTDEILVWLKQSNAALTARPWVGRELIMCAPDIAADTFPHSFAHELGHLFGLLHPWDIEDVADPPIGNPDEYAVDPQTGAHYERADFWDRVFKPSTTAHTFFVDRATALAQESSLREIQSGEPGACNCVESGSLFTCTISSAGGNGNGQNVQQINSNHTQMRGLSFFSGTHFYMSATGYSQAQTPRFFSESEILMMRKHLRWDSAMYTPEFYEDFNEVAYDWQPSNRLARLGTGSFRDSLAKVDFNNDGLRDLAVWTPPTTATGAGRLRVLLSPAYPTTPGQHIDTQFGRLGDIPVVADFDSDGRSDFGVYQPGGGAGRSEPANAQAYWRWCLTSSSPAATNCSAISQTTCPANNCVAWGLRSDIPTPGLEMTGTLPNERSVYRSSQALWYWQTSSLQSRVVGTTSGGSTTGPNAILMPGLYDSDSLSDLVIYYPGMARYYYALSSQSWTTNNQKDMGSQFIPATSGSASARCGALPMPMFRQALQWVCGSVCAWVPVKRKTFSVFWPHDGTWNTVWDPFGAGTIESCVYGMNAADQPFTGFDRNGDLQADWGVFRDFAAGGSSELLTRTTVAGSCAGGTGVAATCGGTSCNARTRVVPVGDMTTDGREELLLLNPDSGTVEWRTSNSNYSTTGGSWATGDPTAIVL